MPHLRFAPCMAKCYLAWPLFPCGFMFHQHKRQPVPPEPGPARLVSADPDMAGGWIPICSEVESLGKAGQTGFLDSKSVLGKSLGHCIFFTDPRTPRAGAAPSSIPKWEMEAGDRVISHTSTYWCVCTCVYHGERPWEWKGREGGVPPICPGVALQMVPFTKLPLHPQSLRLIFPGFSLKSRGSSSLHGWGFTLAATKDKNNAFLNEALWFGLPVGESP